MTVPARRVALIAVGIVAGVAVLGAGAYSVAAATGLVRGPQPAFPPPLAEKIAAAPAPPSAAATTASAPVVVAIGDSIMSGHGLDPAQAWPALLAADSGWQLSNLAADGAGFVTPGDDGSTFQAQVDAAVQLKPSVVVISASSNDLGQGDLAAGQATLAALESLRSALPQAQIVGVSAFWGDEAPPEQLGRLNADLQASVLAVGGDYLDIGQPLADQANLMQDDDVHPTEVGQQQLAAVIGPQLDAVLAGAPASPGVR